MEFTENQTQLLSEPINPDEVSFRAGGGGMKLAYVESWKVMDECNRIFGFGAWSSETIETICVNSEPQSVTYTAKVRITVGDIVREGVGAGHGKLKSGIGDNHESAIKEAESDARKRALISFGDQFGLSLYDKDKKWASNSRERPQNTPSIAELAFKYIEKADSPQKLSQIQQRLDASFRDGKISDKDIFKLKNAIVQKEASLL